MVVKKALTEHLDMDPKTTLGVLCDQILPQSDTTDEEEISIRERLRSLVLAFLAGEAKRAICERFAVPGENGEPVLYEGLFAVCFDGTYRLFRLLMLLLRALGDSTPRNKRLAADHQGLDV